MGRRPMPRQRGLFVKSPLWNPEKQRLTFIVWFFIVCYQGIKRPAYMPPIRLRRRNALVQRVAKSTRKSQPSAASNYQAVFMGLRPIPRQRGLFVKSPLWNPEKQRLTFIVWLFTVCYQGIKRPACMPPTRLRRREALDQRIASLTSKTRPSVASNYQAVFMGLRPIPRQRGLFVKSPLWNPEKQRLTFIVWFFIVRSQGIKRPAYTPPMRLRRR